MGNLPTNARTSAAAYTAHQTLVCATALAQNYHGKHNSVRTRVSFIVGLYSFVGGGEAFVIIYYGQLYLFYHMNVVGHT